MSVTPARYWRRCDLHLLPGVIVVKSALSISISAARSVIPLRFHRITVACCFGIVHCYYMCVVMRRTPSPRVTSSSIAFPRKFARRELPDERESLSPAPLRGCAETIKTRALVHERLRPSGSGRRVGEDPRSTLRRSDRRGYLLHPRRA